MLRSIPVMDETNNYGLWGTHPEDHVVHILLARNKSFLHWYQSTATSSQQTMIQSWSSYPRLWKSKAMTDDVLEIALMAWFNLTVTPTISSSTAAMDIDSCSVANYRLNSPDQVALRTWSEPSCHYTIKSLETGRKQLHYNSSTTLHCNSNLVSITRLIHYDCFKRASREPSYSNKFHKHSMAWNIS